MTGTGQQIEVVTDRDRAEVLLHPLRQRVLAAARDPGSAAELARRLGLKPQRVNYHVQRLAQHGFLRKVEERRAGNVVEKVYAASAAGYVLSSAVLGPLSAGAVEPEADTADRWLWLQSRAEDELADGTRGGGAGGRSPDALAMDAEFRFETAEQRARFVRAARELFGAVVSKYASPARTESGERGKGLPYRLLLGCYPIGEDPAAAAAGEQAAGGEDESRGSAPADEAQGDRYR